MKNSNLKIITLNIHTFSWKREKEIVKERGDSNLSLFLELHSVLGHKISSIVQLWKQKNHPSTTHKILRKYCSCFEIFACICYVISRDKENSRKKNLQSSCSFYKILQQLDCVFALVLPFWCELTELLAYSCLFFLISSGNSSNTHLVGC